MARFPLEISLGDYTPERNKLDNNMYQKSIFADRPEKRQLINKRCLFTFIDKALRNFQIAIWVNF